MFGVLLNTLNNRRLRKNLVMLKMTNYPLTHFPLTTVFFPSLEWSLTPNLLSNWFFFLNPNFF